MLNERAIDIPQTDYPSSPSDHLSAFPIRLLQFPPIPSAVPARRHARRPTRSSGARPQRAATWRLIFCSVCSVCSTSGMAWAVKDGGWPLFHKLSRHSLQHSSARQLRNDVSGALLQHPSSSLGLFGCTAPIQQVFGAEYATSSNPLHRCCSRARKGPRVTNRRADVRRWVNAVRNHQMRRACSGFSHRRQWIPDPPIIRADPPPDFGSLWY